MSDAEIRRLTWRCRRGTKELDEILSNFLQNRLADLDAHERRSFARLLECTDMQLSEWLIADAHGDARPSPTDPHLNEIVRRILHADCG